jgi:hypothetical protein
MTGRISPGDVVVYRKQKSSLRPGPHARDIYPAAHGDAYCYSVEKFWRVVSVGPGDTLVVRTRRGKQHRLAAHDPNLRPSHWWERVRFRRRIPPPAPGGY